MGIVSILLLLGSTAAVIAAFVNGLNVVHDAAGVLHHSYWALGALFAVLSANVFAMFHAAQSDRLIRSLRAELAAERGEPEVAAAESGDIEAAR